MLLAKNCSQLINRHFQANKNIIPSVLSILVTNDNLIFIQRNWSNKEAGKEYFAKIKTTLNSKSSIKPESTTRRFRSRIVKSVPEASVNDNTTKEDENLQSQTNNIVKNKAAVIFSEHYDESELCKKKLSSDITAANSDFANQEDIDDTIHFDKGENILSVDEVAPSLPVSFNFAPYVERSETLREFVKLGVELYRLEVDPKIAEFILRLDFKKDVQPYIQFLNDKGVPPEELGRFITRNPLIFQHTLENLQIRINYLESKKFDDDAVAKIITQSPKHLNFSTVEIDRQLGYIQKTFSLSGDEVRSVVTTSPKLCYWKLYKLQEMNMSMKDEFGFSFEEIKSIFLKQPSIWLTERYKIQERFHLIHNVLGVNHELISMDPTALLHRQSRIRERHLYLKSLNRAQYDPSKPNYVSLRALVTGLDSEFCENIAKTSVMKFNDFLKTL